MFMLVHFPQTYLRELGPTQHRTVINMKALGGPVNVMAGARKAIRAETAIVVTGTRTCNPGRASIAQPLAMSILGILKTTSSMVRVNTFGRAAPAMTENG